jgi:hypothetical protein
MTEKDRERILKAKAAESQRLAASAEQQAEREKAGLPPTLWGIPIIVDDGRSRQKPSAN